MYQLVYISLTYLHNCYRCAFLSECLVTCREKPNWMYRTTLGAADVTNRKYVLTTIRTKTQSNNATPSFLAANHNQCRFVQTHSTIDRDHYILSETVSE